MKKITKKIATLTMALTLIGTSSTLSNAYSNTITAKSANPVCQYHDGSKQNGVKINNYVADNGHRKCKSCGQITGEIKCSNHDWMKTETGKWGNKKKQGFGLCLCWKHNLAHFVTDYYETRTITYRCTICDRKKTKKQGRHAYYRDGYVDWATKAEDLD